MIHTGIGPFDIDRGTFLAYGKVNYSRGATRLNAFVNHLDGNATNRCRAASTAFIPFSFKNTTFDVEAGDVTTWRNRHVFSLAATSATTCSISRWRRSATHARRAASTDRTRFSCPTFRAVIGGRVDAFSSIDGAVFSPRITFIFKPRPAHTVRVSFNRAYRAPSLVNNYLDMTLINELDLGALNPALAGRVHLPVAPPSATRPHRGIADRLRDRLLGSHRQPRNGQRRVLRQRQQQLDLLHTERLVPATNPPPGWPLPPAALELIFLSGRFGPGNGLPRRSPT